MNDRIQHDWPGKGAAESGQVHPAVLHMLDVAAVAEALLTPLPFSRALRQALALLAALHDLGKISASFRAMLRDGRSQSFRHWEITEALLWLHDDRLASLGSSGHVRRELYAAIAGHHGRPPVNQLGFNRTGRAPGGAWQAMLDAAGEQAVMDSGAVIDAFRTLWPEASVERMTLSEAKALSWRLNGMLTLADWLGSNTEWFPPAPPATDLAVYLAGARCRAAPALAASGVLAPPPGTAALFDFEPRPMQAVCNEVPLNDGPMLALIEDETGAGKTEAALVLARRMLDAGKARGLYFALPTMATADAMFARLAPVLPRLFVRAPTLTLAHGRAGLSDRYRDLTLARERSQDESGPTPWLRDSRRRALLAAVGIGTIDQALLAVLRAKHATLRQFGLASKVLIVDEVHETTDPYMGTVLARLLQVHAAQGGSAILMSATLPLDLRARLVEAFEAGAGRLTRGPDSLAYPALTIPGIAAPVVASRPSSRGVVAVRRLASSGSAIDLLQETVARGAAAVWVRNAVDEAISAVAELRRRGVAADLLHARFALCDRKHHEAAALGTFGKARQDCPARVLVATQVVESSLDLDFDVMVSDLAPMAALIQRAGRLWRHMTERPQGARPVPAPVLHVLSPDPDCVRGPDWVGPVLGQGARVYDGATLWRTARALFDAGAISAPEGLRALVEAAHGDGPVPPALEAADIAATGEAGAGRAHAIQNVIAGEQGYRMGASGADEADYPTRLGRPTRALVLMRPDGTPWSGANWSVDSCQLSEVSAGKARLDRLPIPLQAPPEGLPDWLTTSRSFVTVGQVGMICDELGYDRQVGLVFLDRRG